MTRRGMRWSAFDQDVRLLIMTHQNGTGVRVVEFLMGSWAGVGRSRYLESTSKLVCVCVLEVVRRDRAWCGCRVWSSGGNGCGGEAGGGDTLRPIPGLCRARNAIEGSGTGEADIGYMHIKAVGNAERTYAAFLR